VPFPSSFRTGAVLWQHGSGERLTAEALAKHLADAFIADGAAVTNLDGPYFEFRFTAWDAWTRQGVPQIIRSGTLAVRSQEHSLAIDAQGNVRVLPIVLILGAGSVVPFLTGVPPIGSLAGLVVAGYFFTASYLQAMGRLKAYIDRACTRIRDGISSAA